MRSDIAKGLPWQRFIPLYPKGRVGRHLRCLGVLACLMGLGCLIVYATGGTAYAYPYLMLIPVILSAAWYHVYGGLTAAFVAASLLACLPLEVATGTTQPISNYLVRLSLYLAIGGFTGWLFKMLEEANRLREMVLRHDPRSGLLNLVALEESLSCDVLAPAEQRASMALFLVRITDITDVLEALGADATDALVTALGTRFRVEFPAIEGVYRYGNAEMLLLFRDIRRPDIARLAEALSEAGERNIVIQDLPIRPQLVLGSALGRRDGNLFDDLIRESRMAMLAALEHKRSHCHYSPDYQRRTLQTVQLISRVRRGVEREEFELHYQPKIRLADGRVCGCEALLRWRSDDGSLVAPGLFMPKVEDTSLIAPITEYVTERACRFVMQHDEPVSINFSVRNLYDESLLYRLQALVESQGIDPRRLEVEITEGALIQDLAFAKAVIQKIRDFGAGVSIDDFGTGFSSFKYLRHLPISGLKIDRAFVQDLESDPRARALMKCMIEVGHALSLTVTAEGVETDEQYKILSDLGCDQIQGFLISPALPPEAYLAWRRTHAARALPGMIR
ncbi:putative bifunctional diguanylate cyclase/phosphodiesterase [Modicisalibacter coralii]|uniref:putative bifunctional diguanylate cyclase/phosphodiesterase n=1 Tax=Modicisalibacter coralii TaxID=2304602 RepID=UPI001396BD3A|nr:bifunctional diguanylate cyclase/phosphodiesterase [Halomonas coralii]